MNKNYDSAFEKELPEITEEDLDLDRKSVV